MYHIYTTPFFARLVGITTDYFYYFIYLNKLIFGLLHGILLFKLSIALAIIMTLVSGIIGYLFGYLNKRLGNGIIVPR